MANTPVYGWETPDDTDYVYQGAAAARTTANAIDSTVSSQFSATGYGRKTYVLNSGTTFASTGARTLCFTAPAFTPVAGRLYEVTWTLGNISKTTFGGVIYAQLRKNNTAGALLDSAVWQSVAAGDGFPFSKTVVMSSSELGTTSFAPAVTIEASNSGVYVESTAGSIYGYATILINDIGPL